MDKNQVLAFLRQKISDGTISSSDLASFFGDAKPISQVNNPNTQTQPQGATGHSLIVKVLYALGALITIIGAGILVADNWDTLGSAGRILVSLGLSLVAYVFGLVSSERGSRALASVAYVISLALVPFGVAVSFYELDIDATFVNQAIVASVSALLFGFAAWRSKLPVPLLGFAASASWAYATIILEIAEKFSEPESLIRAAVVIAGFAYAAVAWRPAINASQPSEANQARALRELFGLATVACLISVAFSFEPDWRIIAGATVAGAMVFGVAGRLGGALLVSIISIFWMVVAYYGAWSVLPLALSFAAIYAAISARSSKALFLGAATVVASVIRVGGELFVDYFGWAVSLMAFGFLLIGAGYAAVQLNKKYIRN